MSTILATPAEVQERSLEVRPNTSHGDRVFRTLVAVSTPEQQIDAKLLDGIDWDSLLHQARHHSLIPLLSHRLLDADLAMPSQIRARLRSEFQANLRRNFGLFEEVRRVLQAWRQEGIEGVAYKGPVLAEQLWDSLTLRECSDLDFLVPRADVRRAGEILHELGYSPATPVAEALRPALLRDASEEQFRHSSTNILLELQWAPAPRTLAVPYDEEGLWRNRRSVSISGESFNTPSPEDLVGLLAIHGWKHNWSKLIWVADLANVIRRNEIDWQRLYRSATQDGWKRVLLLGLEMVRRVFGLPVFVKSDPDSGILELAERLERNLKRAKNNSYLEWHRDMLRARDSGGSQLRQIANFVFTPGLAEYSSSNLPGWASPAYRLIRLARVLSLWPEKAIE